MHVQRVCVPACRVPPCRAPCAWVWQRQMLKPAPAARLPTQPSLNQSASLSGLYLRRPGWLRFLVFHRNCFFSDIHFLFFYAKSRPAAKKGRCCSQKSWPCFKCVWSHMMVSLLMRLLLCSDWFILAVLVKTRIRLKHTVIYPKRVTKRFQLRHICCKIHTFCAVLMENLIFVLSIHNTLSVKLP